MGVLRALGVFIFCPPPTHAWWLGQRRHGAGTRGARARAEKLAWPESWGDRLSPEVDFLGEGGFATVYAATVRCDGSRVAVKRIEGHGDVASHEAGMLRAFASSPSFVTYFDHTEGPGDGGKAVHYIMMELAEGGDLGAVISGKNRATLRQRYALFYSILEGVKHLHDRAVVHRDLKPGNILVSGPCDGGAAPCAAKLADLGAACQVRGAPPIFEGAQACSGSLFTHQYGAPELVNHGVIDPKNDVWALGVILFELTFDTTLPVDVVDRTVLWGAERPFVLDIMIQTLPDGSPVRELLEGMLRFSLRDRLSSQDALDLALPLADPSARASVASLPACFHHFGDPGHRQQVEDFTLEGVPTNVIAIVMSYVFNDRLVDPKTGAVVDPKGKLQYLRSRSYFPKSLKLGGRVLEVNHRPFASITPQERRRFKEGCCGGSLSIKYVQMPPSRA